MVLPDDPVAGWEQFFTDRDKYVFNPDNKEELFPHRGFFSCYPLKQDVGIGGVKAGSAVLAEFADVRDTGEVLPGLRSQLFAPCREKNTTRAPKHMPVNTAPRLSHGIQHRPR